jgi:hypothetical protein
MSCCAPARKSHGFSSPPLMTCLHYPDVATVSPLVEAPLSGLATYDRSRVGELLVGSYGHRLYQKLVPTFGVKRWLLFHSLQQDCRAFISNVQQA